MTNCEGELESIAEWDEHGPLWVHTCQHCGTRWEHQTGVYLPSDEPPPPPEFALIVWFRCLPRKLQAAVVFHVHSLAVATDNAR